MEKKKETQVTEPTSFVVLEAQAEGTAPAKNAALTERTVRVTISVPPCICDDAMELYSRLLFAGPSLKVPFLGPSILWKLLVIRNLPYVPSLDMRFLQRAFDPKAVAEVVDSKVFTMTSQKAQYFALRSLRVAPEGVKERLRLSSPALFSAVYNGCRGYCMARHNKKYYSARITGWKDDMFEGHFVDDGHKFKHQFGNMLHMCAE